MIDFKNTMISVLFRNLKDFFIKDIRLKKIRCEQDLNLCGKIPTDFKSVALTTRPSQLLSLQNFKPIYIHENFLFL